MRVKLYILLLVAAFSTGFCSCKKVPLTNGKTITESRPLPNFNRVKIYDDISVTFVKSDSCWVEITTGENLMDNIITSVDTSNNTLSLKNDNQIAFLRPYDFTLHLTLYFKELRYVRTSSSGYINSETQLNDDNQYFVFEIGDGCSGDIDVIINNSKKATINYFLSTSTARFDGSGNKRIDFHKESYGSLDARNLEAEDVKIFTKSPGDCYISASKRIDAEINHLGNVYYKGNPDEINVKYGPIARGRLIPL